MKTTYKQDDSAKCLECGDRFVSLRSTMKFCCDKCRYDYYNRLNSGIRLARNRSLRDIEKNYEILKSLLENGITELPLLQLNAMGFACGRVTAVVRSKRHLELCVYDIQYKQSDTRVYDIEKVSLNLHSSKKHYGQ